MPDTVTLRMALREIDKSIAQLNLELQGINEELRVTDDPATRLKLLECYRHVSDKRNHLEVVKLKFIEGQLYSESRRKKLADLTKELDDAVTANEKYADSISEVTSIASGIGDAAEALLNSGE